MITGTFLFVGGMILFPFSFSLFSLYLFTCCPCSSLTGADINSQAADGATALYEAAKNEHQDIVEFLISQKADANKPGKTGLLPLHVASQTGNEA